MNKGIKNLWICLLTAALTLGGMAVMAQGTDSVSEDFSGMTAQNVADYVECNSQITVSAQAHRAAPVYGKGGKPNSDASLLVESLPGAEYTSANNAPAVTKQLPLRRLSGGEILRVSFDFLNGDWGGMKKVKLNLIPASANSEADAQSFEALQIRKDWKNNQFFGKEIPMNPTNIRINSWYRFDIFLNSADNTASIYMNGTLLTSAEFAFANPADLLGGIASVSFENLVGAEAKNYGTYFCVDNLKAEILSQIPPLEAIGVESSVDFEMIDPNLDASGNTALQEVYVKTAASNVTGGNYSKLTEAAKAGGGDVARYETEENVFGKQGKALHMYNGSTLNAGHIFTQLNTNMDMRDCNEKTLLSYEVALDPKNTRSQELVGRIVYTNGSATRNAGEKNLARLTANGELSLCGKAVGRLKQGRWYKIDLILDAATATAAGYVNGREQFTAQPVDASIQMGESISQINTMRFQYYPGLDSGKGFTADGNTYYPAAGGGVYYDDIQVKYFGGAAPAQFDTALRHTRYGDAVTLDTVTLPAGSTVEDFLNGASANGAAISVLGAQGQPVGSGPVIGCKVLVESLYGGPAVYDVAEKVQEVLADENFNAPFADDTIPSPLKMEKVGGAYNKISCRQELGVSGKDSANGAFMLDIKNWLGDSDPAGARDPYLILNIARKTQYTVEASVLPGDDVSFVFCLDGKNITLGGFSTVAEAVYMGSGNAFKASELEKDKWYRMAVTLYPGTNYCDLWFNGRLVEKNHVIREFPEKYEEIQYVRLHSWLHGGSEKEPLNVTLGFDDIKAYEGGYRGQADSTAEFTTTLNCRKDAGRLYVDGAMEAAEFSGLLLTGGSVRIYQDASLREPLSGDYVEEGNAVVIASPNEEVYAYYQIYNAKKPLRITIDGKPAQALTAGALKAEYDSGADASGTLILAVYDAGGRLLAIGADSAGTEGLYQCGVPSDGGTEVKAMFVDGLASLRPLCAAKRLAA